MPSTMRPLGRAAVPALRPVSINGLALNTTLYYTQSINISTAAIDIGLSSALFGVLTLLVVVAVGFLIRKGLSHTPVKILLLSTLTLYGSTAVFMASLAGHVASVHRLTARAQAGLFSDAYTQADLDAFEGDVMRHAWMMTVALFVNVLIGDSIMWWRVCAIWRNRVIYCIGPVLLVLLAGFGAKAICPEEQCLHPPQQPQMLLGNGFFTNQMAAPMSLALNVLATLLIGYKAWMHRRLLRRHFGRGRQRSHVLSALALLVESGTVYCLLLLIILARLVAPAHFPTPAAHESAVLDAVADYDYACLVPVIAIYPVSIIVIVALNWSPIEHTVSLLSGSECERTRGEAEGERYPSTAVSGTERGTGTDLDGTMMSTVVLADGMQMTDIPTRSQSTSNGDGSAKAETKQGAVAVVI